MFSILAKCGRIQKSVLTKVVYRQYMKVSEKMEMTLKRLDHAPKDAELIYMCDSQTGPTVMYHIMTVAAFVTIGTIGYNIIYPADELTRKERFSKERVGGYKDTPLENTIAVVASALMILGAHIIRQRYVLRIYHSNKTQTYRAIFIGRIPFVLEFYEFPKESVSYVIRDSLLPWKRDLYDVNGRKMLMYDAYFRTPQDLSNMLLKDSCVH